MGFCWWCILLPWFGGCSLWPDILSCDKSSVGVIGSVNFSNQFEDFKKCVVNDGEWSDNNNTCSIGVSTFPAVANYDPELLPALESYFSKTGNEDDAVYFAEYKTAMAEYLGKQA